MSTGQYESVREEIVGWLRSQVGARVPTGPIPDTAEVFGRAGMIDSLALLDLLVMLEGRFGIRLDATEITPERVGTLGDLGRWVASAVEGQG